MADYTIVSGGVGVCIIRFSQEISEQVNAKVKSLCSVLSQLICREKIDGIIEWVPTYCTVAVYFDSLVCNFSDVKKILEAAAENMEISSERKKNVHVIPVCYEGEYAPDLKNVSDHAGLSGKEVVSLHSSKEYPVYMLGFLPGFAYLGGLDERLETPRLKTPRLYIPAGSVAIGGSQTGVYPLNSPGGWQIIGRTPLKMYDERKNPSVFVNAGDRIKFKPISLRTFNKIAKKLEKLSVKKNKKSVASFAVSGGVRILSGGIMTTVQDLGRIGYQRYGFSVSGAADSISFRLANIIAGNPENVPALETTLSGPEMTFISDVDFCITGANQNPLLDGRPVPLYTRVSAHAGSSLILGTALSGMRSYIAFTGGIIVPSVMGSASTSLKYELGGYFGRKIQAGDELAIGFVPERYRKLHVLSEDKNTTIRFLCSSIVTTAHTTNEASAPVLDLRVIKGVQFDAFTKKGIETFTSEIYTVSSDSDRMGCRLLGSAVESKNGTDIISDSIALGSVQISSAGFPIVMLADRQTTGGYAKIATVIPSDIPFLVQSVPGTKIRFRFIEEDEAIAILRVQKRQEFLVSEAVID